MRALTVSLCLSLSYKMMESHISGATADISQASPHLGTLRVSDIVLGSHKRLLSHQQGRLLSYLLPSNLDSSVNCELFWLQKNSSFWFLTLIATPGHKGQNP